MTAFTCPYCGAVSYHPMDIEERYCVRCHIFIDDEKEREMFLHLLRERQRSHPHSAGVVK